MSGLLDRELTATLPYVELCHYARCHNYALDSPLDRETGLDIFRVDPEYEQHEAEYKVRPKMP